MGFLEYARNLSFQKDEMKTKIRVDPKLQQPILEYNEDNTESTVNLPLPSMPKEGIISFLGYEFPEDSTGKTIIGRLFRACVFHLTAHTAIPFYGEKVKQKTSKRELVEVFSEAIARDVYVNSYISTHAPEKIVDLAYASSLALARMKPVERIFNPATRIMAALLTKINTGNVKGALRKEEENTFNQLTTKLSLLKEKIATASMTEEKSKIDEVFSETINDVTQILESHGPILEAPSLPHTERIGPCSVFSQSEVPSELEIEGSLRRSLETLGGTSSPESTVETFWRREVDVEAAQAFDTWLQQKAREERILTKLREYIESTKFKSVDFPEEDYTQYMRARRLVSGGSRRLLDSLRVAQDALDEDPGKEMGQLDLTAVIQVIASRKPATDVFMQDEFLSRSFAWGILFDASASMKINGDFGRALAICVAEAAKELLMDSGSWSLFAFGDRFHVLKDSSEAYSQKIRARIGGLKFEGLSYLPDAIQVAGQILAKRFEEQRFLIVISDGCPYGYPDIDTALSEAISSLEKKGVIIVGIGVATDRMKNFFRLNTPIYDQKDLIKKFSKIYLASSAITLES